MSVHLWDDASRRWLNSRRNEKWYRKDEGYVRRLDEFLLGTPLADIDKSKVAEVREKLLETRGNSTVNRITGVLRTILSCAEDWGMIDHAPKVKRLKEKERIRWITREEAEKLLAALPKRVRPMVQFALATGLRQANVLNLEWNEVSIPRRHLAIPGGKMKNGEPFGAPLNDAAITVLKRQIGRHPKWVFPIKSRGAIGPMKGIDSAMWQRACAKADIEDFTFHDLRHTWASWHIQSGTRTAALRELGGWKSEAMVKRYAHLATEHLANAADNVGQICNPSSPAKKSRTGFKFLRSKRAS